MPGFGILLKNSNSVLYTYYMQMYGYIMYCSETTLTGVSRFHISIPLGIEPISLMTGSKRVDHWTSGTVYGCSEITGSP
jgi:hypothetical protein